MSSPRHFFYASEEDMASDLAGSVAGDLRRETGKALLILPGGSSPRLLMKRLAGEKLEWSRITVTTSDERCVPLESERSNAGQVKNLLGVEPFPLEDKKDITGLPWPAAITVLGMGMDAHIASLFPGERINLADEGLIRATAPAEPRERVSLSMRSLLNTKRLILLVIGTQKWALCQGILDGADRDTPLAKLMELAGARLELHIVDR